MVRRTRAFIAACAVAVAVAVACSRVLLGVHWLSDVLAGLAFGWAWFSICAIAFGGRFVEFGATAERARNIAETSYRSPRHRRSVQGGEYPARRVQGVKTRR
jgi:hypothetical protein